MFNELFYFVYIVIFLLLIATGFYTGETAHKLNLATIILSSLSIGGILLFIVISGIHIQISVGLGPIVIGFVVLLGISLIVLICYNPMEKENFDNSKSFISQSLCTGDWTGKGGCNQYNMNNVNNNESNIKNPFDKNTNLTHKTQSKICQGLDENNKTVFSMSNEVGLCRPVQKAIHDIDKSGAGEAGRGSGTNGSGTNGSGTNGSSNNLNPDNANKSGINDNDIQTEEAADKQQQDDKDAMNKKADETGCVIPIDNNNCRSTDINTHDYCSKKSDGYGMKSIKECCSLDEPKYSGNKKLKKKTHIISCGKGYINGKKYSPSELASSTKCAPMTNDFNNECQMANPPCVSLDMNTCSSNSLCEFDSKSMNCVLKKDADYKYRNNSSRDFGYVKILQGSDGGCNNASGNSDDTYGKAICSPHYYSGIRKSPNTTNCLNSDSDKFGEECVDEYGVNRDAVGSSTAVGCNPTTTRKTCNKSIPPPLNYIGCYANIYDNTSTKVESAIECVNMCKKNVSNKYATITKGDQCACGTSFEELTRNGQEREDNCDKECSKGIEKKCGGNNTFSLYKLN